MLKFTTTAKDGSRLVMLGLSEENVKRLQADQPIAIDLAELGVKTDEPTKVVIFAGTTEAEMIEPLMKAGVLGPATEVNIDPRTIPDRAPQDIVDTIILMLPRDLSALMTPGATADVIHEMQPKLRELAMKQVMGQKFEKEMRRLELRQLTWTITKDADEVATMTPPHDCPDCRQGLTRAAAMMRQKPDTWTAIGKIEYTKHFT